MVVCPSVWNMFFDPLNLFVTKLGMVSGEWSGDRVAKHFSQSERHN